MSKESNLKKFKSIDKKFILFLKKSIRDIQKMQVLVTKEKQNYKLHSILESNYNKSKSIKKKKSKSIKKKKRRFSKKKIYSKAKGGSSNSSGWETTNTNSSELETTNSSELETTNSSELETTNSIINPPHPSRNRTSSNENSFNIYSLKIKESSSRDYDAYPKDYTFYPSDSYDIQLLFIITLVINGITTADENMFIFAFKVTCDLIANISINIKKWLLNYKYKKLDLKFQNTYIFKFIEFILQTAYKILVYLFTRIKLFVSNNKFTIITGICLYYYRYGIINYMIITANNIVLEFISHYFHEELNSYIRTIFLEWIKTHGKEFLLDQSKELTPQLIKELIPALTNSIMPAIQEQLPPMIQNIAIELMPNMIEQQVPALLEPIVTEAIKNAVEESAKNAAQEKLKNAAIMYGTEKVVEAGLRNFLPQLLTLFGTSRQYALT